MQTLKAASVTDDTFHDIVSMINFNSSISLRDKRFPFNSASSSIENKSHYNVVILQSVPHFNFINCAVS